MLNVAVAAHSTRALKGRPAAVDNRRRRMPGGSSQVELEPQPGFSRPAVRDHLRDSGQAQRGTEAHSHGRSSDLKHGCRFVPSLVCKQGVRGSSPLGSTKVRAGLILL